jgi:hypothetical protein
MTNASEDTNLILLELHSSATSIAQTTPLEVS